MEYLVFTTCDDGELRCYPVFLASNPNCVGDILEKAKKQDKNDYPDKPSPFNNVEIIEGGRSIYMCVWGDAV